MKSLVSIILSILLISSFSPAQEASKSSPDLVVHLLDYLAKDYGGAVQSGKVISESEYSEQIEFAEIVEKNSKGFSKLNSDSQFIATIGKLKSMIASKASPEEVSKLARKLQQDAIQLAGISVEPTQWPNLAHGATLYQNNCIACHGDQGRGDGAAGANLDPKPANFHDPDLVWNSAPYKFYNTIRLGVPGTGMAAYAHLSDSDVWALAFYLKSLGYSSQAQTDISKLNLSIKDIANLTDAEIAERLGGKNEQTLAAIAAVRTKTETSSTSDPIQIAENLLNESIKAANSGNYELAENLSLRAYLEGIEPLEPKMKANIPGSVEQIETMMSSYRSSLSKKAPAEQLEAQRAEIVGKLNEAKTIFAENKMSPSVAFGAAFSIFLREGFEAILIIIVLISILKAMGQPQAIRWVHVGWILAVAVGIIAWFASGLLLSMSGLSRELLEGFISLFAVAVLIYVGFWLHRYSEMKKWRSFLEEKLRHGLHTGSYILLAIVSFMAVFREAFEVVLFLRAIWIDLDSSGQTVASLGVAASLVLLIVLAIFAVKESRKLPLGLLFQICSWTMIILAVVLAGKGIHSLQEAGVIPVTTLGLPIRIDLIGLYPNIQTLLGQAAVGLLFVILFIGEKRQASPAH